RRSSRGVPPRRVPARPAPRRLPLRPLRLLRAAAPLAGGAPLHRRAPRPAARHASARAATRLPSPPDAARRRPAVKAAPDAAVSWAISPRPRTVSRTMDRISERYGDLGLLLVRAGV